MTSLCCQTVGSIKYDHMYRDVSSMTDFLNLQ
jgi:hypothetical protein